MSECPKCNSHNVYKKYYGHAGQYDLYNFLCGYCKHEWEGKEMDQQTSDNWDEAISKGWVK